MTSLLYLVTSVYLLEIKALMYLMSLSGLKALLAVKSLELRGHLCQQKIHPCTAILHWLFSAILASAASTTRSAYGHLV